MALIISNTKGVSERPIVVNVVEKVIANPEIFLFISQVFSTFNKNTDSSKEEFYSYIEDVLDAPNFDASMKLKRELNSVLKSIYSFNQEKFNKVRSEILENVVYYFGPCTKNIERNEVYVEPVIRDNDFIVGNSNVKCDFVFYSNILSPIEFIECKTDIGNIIPKNLPFYKIKKSHQRKIKYLDSSYRYLKDKYCEPYIYFACYNLNYKLELQNLRENWGYSHMDFLNAKDIIEGKNY